MHLRLGEVKEKVFGGWEIRMVRREAEEQERQSGEELTLTEVQEERENEEEEQRGEGHQGDEQEALMDVRVGQRVQIYWPLEKQWYKGTVKEQFEDGTWRVVYDDGEDHVEMQRAGEWKELRDEGVKRPAGGTKKSGASVATGEPAKKQKVVRKVRRARSKKKGVMTIKGMVVMGMAIEVYFEEDDKWHRGRLMDSQEGLDFWLGVFEDGTQHWIDIRVTDEWRRPEKQ